MNPVIPKKTAHPELVEGSFFFGTVRKKGQPFDKLKTDGARNELRLIQ